jgi:hypothetical protein
MAFNHILSHHSSRPVHGLRAGDADRVLVGFDLQVVFVDVGQFERLHEVIPLLEDVDRPIAPMAAVLGPTCP